MDDLKEHLFRYRYEGRTYGFSLDASSPADAKERLKQLTFAQYDGELVARIPVPGVPRFAVPIIGGLLTRWFAWSRG